MHTELFASSLTPMFSATETAVKPGLLSVSLSLSLYSWRGGGGGGGPVMKQVFLCVARGLSALHTADLCHLLPPAGGSGGGRGAKPGGQ